MNKEEVQISKLMGNLIDQLHDKKETIGFFDLETQYLFADIDPNWKKLSREKLISKVIPKMKISIAGILTMDKEKEKPLYTYYVIDDLKQLEKDLKKLDKIVGHNLLRFDYDVLSHDFSKTTLEAFRDKTIDTWGLLEESTNQWIKLDDLGKLNFNVTKTVDTLKIPKMWRDGKHKEVREYLKRDLDILACVFYNGINGIPIKYYKKDYGKIIGRKSKVFNWGKLIK